MNTISRKAEYFRKEDREFQELYRPRSQSLAHWSEETLVLFRAACVGWTEDSFMLEISPSMVRLETSKYFVAECSTQMGLVNLVSRSLTLITRLKQTLVQQPEASSCRDAKLLVPLIGCLKVFHDSHGKKVFEVTTRTRGFVSTVQNNYINAVDNRSHDILSKLKKNPLNYDHQYSDAFKSPVKAAELPQSLQAPPTEHIKEIQTFEEEVPNQKTEEAITVYEIQNLNSLKLSPASTNDTDTEETPKKKMMPPTIKLTKKKPKRKPVLGNPDNCIEKDEQLYQIFLQNQQILAEERNRVYSYVYQPNMNPILYQQTETAAVDEQKIQPALPRKYDSFVLKDLWLNPEAELRTENN